MLVPLFLAPVTGAAAVYAYREAAAARDAMTARARELGPALLQNDDLIVRLYRRVELWGFLAGIGLLGTIVLIAFGLARH